jgi:hypothetical protein
VKIEGDVPDPETVARPEVARELMLQVNALVVESTSVAFNSGSAHAVGFPFPDIEMVNGPVP